MTRPHYVLPSIDTQDFRNTQLSSSRTVPCPKAPTLSTYYTDQLALSSSNTERLSSPPPPCASPDRQSSRSDTEAPASAPLEKRHKRESGRTQTPVARLAGCGCLAEWLASACPGRREHPISPLRRPSRPAAFPFSAPNTRTQKRREPPSPPPSTLLYTTRATGESLRRSRQDKLSPSCDARRPLPPLMVATSARCSSVVCFISSKRSSFQNRGADTSGW